jgi:hypothetical protein
MRAWFVATAFLGAALLFVVEPAVGKLLLPRLGGAPAVWGTCLVFFQAALLAGYAWAHLVASRVPRRVQPIVHGVLLAVAFVSLPLRGPEGAPPPEQAFPVAWLLSRLATTVGLPFVAVSATGPLVQRWYASTRRDPYFLFAASNAGSFAALLAYPLVVEPLLPLGRQISLWSSGYVILVVLLAGCAASLIRESTGRRQDGEDGKDGQINPTFPSSRLPVQSSRSRWLALALVPSALMLGVTTFVTTDVAPVPLLWVVPLALYLAAFVVPFAERPLIAHDRVLRVLPAAVLVLAFTIVVGSDRLLWVVALLHFAAFFVIALACHGELARLRPAPDRLTAFYLVVSAGGVLGGALVAFVAPLVFPSVWEYPIALVAACALRPGMPAGQGGRDEHAADFEELAWADANVGRRRPWPARARKMLRVGAFPAATLLVLTAAMVALARADDTWRLFVVAQLATAACVVAWSMRARPWRFTAMVASILLAPAVGLLAVRPLFLGRSFFALHRVIDDASEHRHLYVQGTTIHGLESTDPDKRRIPGAYFHPTGPAGDVLSRIGPKRVALVGLGVASLASYAERGQSFTFYEIDPVVVRVAEDPNLFRFIADARDRGARVDVVLGDARVRLAQEEDATFDLLVLDAYSSDVVPAHLLTREAFALYFRKLVPRALVLMNVSNRYLDLGRVVDAIARDGGLVARERLDDLETEEDRRAAREDGKAPSRWIVIARGAGELDALDLPPTWRALEPSGMRVWTDDYVNVVGCFRF